MNIARRRPSVAILSLAISLCLMAFSASAAQATTWMVNGTNVTSKLSVGMTFTPTSKKITLLSKVGGVAFALSCEGLEFLNAALEPSGLATGEFFWRGCQVKLGEKEEVSEACKPKEPIDLNESVKGEKEEGKDDEEFSSSATIEFPNEKCSFSGKLALSGIYWIEDTSGEWEVEKLAHTVQEAMTVALTLGGLKLGAEPAFIDGGIKIEVNDGGPKKFSALF